MSVAAASATAAAAARPRPRARFVGVRERFGGYAVGAAVLVALYYGSARLGFALAFAGPVGAVAWLPVGVAVAFLALFGLRFWPAALVADLLVNNELSLPLGGALGQTFGNVLEVLLAAWLVRRLLSRESPLARVPDVGRLVVALAAGTLASAVVGPLSLLEAGALARASLFAAMRTWWLGDFCGALVIVPLALTWRRVQALHVGRSLTEAGILLAGIACVSVVAASAGDPLTYLVFPLLGWMVFRFGARGATAGILVTVSATVVAATRVNGPFASNSFAHSVLSTQLFVVVAALAALFFAAVVSEHRMLQNSLDFSRARTIHAAEAERARIERDLHDGAQQRLLAVAMHLRLAAEQADVSADARSMFAFVEQEIQVAVDELRELSHGVHPRVLTELGLRGAIQSLAGRSVVPVTLTPIPSLRLDGAAEAAAYFVAVEAVANVHKYARATAIRIEMSYAVPWLCVAVVDDGRGGAEERPGSGLAGLRERVEVLDGEFSVQSSGRGTTVSARIPAFPA